MSLSSANVTGSAEARIAATVGDAPVVGARSHSAARLASPASGSALSGESVPTTSTRRARAVAPAGPVTHQEVTPVNATHTTPQEEERDARRKQRQVQRASRARVEQHAREIWRKVQTYRRGKRCSCPIRSGMTRDELRDLGAGCTSPDYVCPVLDTYRRYVG